MIGVRPARGAGAHVLGRVGKTQCTGEYVTTACRSSSSKLLDWLAHLVWILFEVFPPLCTALSHPLLSLQLPSTFPKYWQDRRQPLQKLIQLHTCRLPGWYLWLMKAWLPELITLEFPLQLFFILISLCKS